MAWQDSEHLSLLSLGMGKPEQRMDKGTVEYLDYCAHIGDATGKVAMGHLYHSGTHGVPCDRRAAAHWFRSAAALGEGMGHANDGMMRLRAAGAGAGREAAGAVRALRRAAKLQDPSGWAGLAYAHLYGAGVKQVRVRVRVRVSVSRVRVRVRVGVRVRLGFRVMV